METVIEPNRSEKTYWGDLWRYRELFYILAWRDVAVRYKQTFLGVAWAVLKPLLTTAVFAIVFGKLAKISTPSAVPYVLFVMAGMLPWQFFATALSESSGSLIANANLISKIYFPRLIIPAAAVITSLVDFAITLGMIMVLMAWYQFIPDWRLVFIPAFMLLACCSSIGLGLWLCALNIEYRDFRYVVPFFIQFGLYISPVGFGSRIVPEKWRLIFALNPMVGVIDGFRWSLLRGEGQLDPRTLAISMGMAIFLTWTGILYFRKMEKKFADII
jgi:lipopolysaccharide transport system permease protein